MLSRLVAAAAAATSEPALTMTTYDWVPSDVEAPCIYPADWGIDWDRTMGRGTDEYEVTLHLLCARIDDREGQRMLAGYMKGAGPSSVKAAIEADRTLGGAVDTLRVARSVGPRKYDIGEASYAGADITVRLFGSGT